MWVSEQEKIAALGVHLRRNVTSYGVGLNVSTDLRWFDRIVACGLEGKGMTSMEQQGGNIEDLEWEGLRRKPTTIADLWAKEFAHGLWGIDSEIRKINDGEV